MPRIRIRTPDGERVVGTCNCSVLSVELVTHAQRHTLQLRADAKLIAGDSVLEHASWAWPELSDTTTVELISEPLAGPFAAYDPPDAFHQPKAAPSLSPERQRAAELDYETAQRDLQEAVEQLQAIPGCPAPVAAAGAATPKPPSAYCSFCHESQADVRKLVAGPGVYICDECVQIASRMLAD